MQRDGLGPEGTLDARGHGPRRGVVKADFRSGAFSTAFSFRLNRVFLNRGDKTPLELFIAGVRGWDGHFRGQFENGKSK